MKKNDDSIMINYQEGPVIDLSKVKAVDVSFVPSEKVLQSRHNVLKTAIDTFGTEKQIEKFQEECAELSLAIIRYKNNPSDPQVCEDLIDEIADVTIMLEQATILFPKNLIDKRINYKIQRLETRLEKLNQR